jgi:hypothetical protein
MKVEEVIYFLKALKEIVINFTKWKKDYIYNAKKNEFEHHSSSVASNVKVEDWFKL